MNRDLTTRMTELLRQYWAITAGASARVIIAGVVVNAVALALLDYLLLGPGAVLTTFGAGLGLALGAYVWAPIVALVGWPIRGEFRMRPLYCASLAAFTVQYLILHVLLPLAFVPTVGPLFALAVVIVTVLAALISTGAFWMTLLPHRLAGRIAWVTLVIALGTGARAYLSQISSGQDAVMQAVFEAAEPRVVRLLEPRRAPASVLDDEFRAMARDFARPAYAK